MSLEALSFTGWHLTGIGLGGVAYFALGGLWYMKLFTKPWLAATGRAPDEFKDGPGIGMLYNFLGSMLSVTVLALVYGWASGETLLDGLLIGAVLGIGVAGTERIKTAVFNFDERVKPWALFAVDASYSVCGLMLAGLVYAFFTGLA